MTQEGKFRRQNLKIFFVLGSLQFFLVAFLGYVCEGCVGYAFMAIGKLMLYISYLVDLLCCFRCELMQGPVRTPLMVLCALRDGMSSSNIMRACKLKRRCSSKPCWLVKIYTRVLGNLISFPFVLSLSFGDKRKVAGGCNSRDYGALFRISTRKMPGWEWSVLSVLVNSSLTIGVGLHFLSRAWLICM